MNKTKLAICMKDLEYQTRFVSCFMNHYNHQYELHVFTSPMQMEESSSKEYAAIITGEYNTEEMAVFVEKGEIVLSLEENWEKENTLENQQLCTEKYQEVYKIVELIERLIAEKRPGKFIRKSSSGYEMIGIYSLSQEVNQAPFAAVMGKVYGEQQKVLVMDLQSYSGIREIEEETSSMGLEDLLSVVQTGNYSKSRVLECIRHESNWDYVCAVQNQQCIAEGSRDLYEAIIEKLVEELGYEVVIINFGTVFLGQLDLMDACHKIYLLKERAGESNWRECIFEREVLRQGKETLLQKLRKIELPQTFHRENSWKVISEKWTWGELGELLRQERKREKAYGEVM